MKDLEQNVAEDVLGAAKDGSDLAQDVAVDVLGAATNGSVKVSLSSSKPFPLRQPLASGLSFPCPCGSACAAACWPEWCPSAAIGVRVPSSRCAHRRVKHPFNV